jgi:hypothetical protein
VLKDLVVVVGRGADDFGDGGGGKSFTTSSSSSSSSVSNNNGSGANEDVAAVIVESDYVNGGFVEVMPEDNKSGTDDERENARYTSSSWLSLWRKGCR